LDIKKGFQHFKVISLIGAAHIRQINLWLTPSREENIQECQGEDINDIILDLGVGRTTESIVEQLTWQYADSGFCHTFLLLLAAPIEFWP
jgi:hypothetical protein